MDEARKNTKQLIEKVRDYQNSPNRVVQGIANKVVTSILPGGGLIDGIISVFEEHNSNKDQHKIFELIARILQSIVDKIESELPTEDKLKELLNKIFGKVVNAKEGDSGYLMLHPQTREDLQPYVELGMIRIDSTNSTCSMGAKNRIGNHFEELFRPYGLGNGFRFTILRNILYISQIFIICTKN